MTEVTQNFNLFPGSSNCHAGSSSRRSTSTAQSMGISGDSVAKETVVDALCLSANLLNFCSSD